MSSDDDKFWDTVANQLRKKKGYCPLTDEEAESALDEISDEAPPSIDEALGIVKQLIREEEPKPRPLIELANRRRADGRPPLSEKLRREFGSVCRNAGEHDDETASKEEKLVQDMLNEGDDVESDEQA